MDLGMATGIAAAGVVILGLRIGVAVHIAQFLEHEVQGQLCTRKENCSCEDHSIDYFNDVIITKGPPVFRQRALCVFRRRQDGNPARSLRMPTK
ncbi:hypothetical protein [Streptomyces californicus]|uniref:hypothetical protein n=1 Tax=Streptomyces californicus TaxID=67351 RepID=UPI0037015D4B